MTVGRGIWVCITAKDEAETIGSLVQDLRGRGYGVVVVDDGSLDGTGRFAGWAGAMVINHYVSEGIGPSLMEAWRLALEEGAGWIVQMDAGGSHDTADLARLLAGAVAGVDVVIGSRFCAGGGYEGRRWRAWCSRLAAVVMNLSQHGVWIQDWTSGFRAFSAVAAERLLGYRYEAKMHGWQIEVLGRARLMGLGVAEVPICYRAGRSSLRLATVDEAVRMWLAVLHHMQVFR